VNTTAINHRSTGAQAIRIVSLIAVLILAAALGMVVGNALKGSDDAATVGQAATDTTSSSFSLDAIRHLQAARGDAGAEMGAPTYADPYRAYIGATNVAPAQTDPRAHLWAPIDTGLVAPQATDPRPHLWAPIDTDDEKSSLTRPTPR
jgi:hypothetical protein